MACKVARAAWAEGGDHPSLCVLTSTHGAICDQSPGALSWSGPKQGTKPLFTSSSGLSLWAGGEGSFERENCTWGIHVQWWPGPGVAGGGVVMIDGQGAICCHNTAPAICKMLHVQQLCLNNQADKTWFNSTWSIWWPSSCPSPRWCWCQWWPSGSVWALGATRSACPQVTSGHCCPPMPGLGCNLSVSYASLSGFAFHCRPFPRPPLHDYVKTLQSCQLSPRLTSWPPVLLCWLLADCNWHFLHRRLCAIAMKCIEMTEYRKPPSPSSPCITTVALPWLDPGD